MNINPTGVIASAAGTPLAQTTGSDVERAHAEVAAQRRRVYHEAKAAAAAGVGQPDGEDHEAEQRDADGRRLWEMPPPAAAIDAAAPPRSADPSHQRGNLLDLDG